MQRPAQRLYKELMPLHSLLQLEQAASEAILGMFAEEIVHGGPQTSLAGRGISHRPLQQMLVCAFALTSIVSSRRRALRLSRQGADFFRPPGELGDPPES